jgi:hypothetical protein
MLISSSGLGPAGRVLESSQLASDRVRLSAEAGLGITAEREVVTIGADRTCRVTKESGEAAFLTAVSDIMRVHSDPYETPTNRGQSSCGIAVILVESRCHQVAVREEFGLGEVVLEFPWVCQNGVDFA